METDFEEGRGLQFVGCVEVIQMVSLSLLHLYYHHHRHHLFISGKKAHKNTHSHTYRVGQK